MTKKNINTLERVFKGVANHWRIEVLLLVAERPGITLDEIVTALKGNYQTLSEHVKRVRSAGLITKQYHGRSVAHNLSPFGVKAVKILKTFLD